MAENNELEKTLWAAADKLRSNMDAAEYKHIVLGLIFLKYISDAFNDLHEKLKAGKGEFEGADPEDPDEYLADNIFFCTGRIPLAIFTGPGQTAGGWKMA
jgi:type I restriction enzyme M protein